jgi:ATP-dependent RNA helicase RhlE
MSFQSLGLSKHLLLALKKLGFEEAYPIQEKAIPFLLKGKDLLGIAPTGSGKTIAYALPILEKIISQKTTNNRFVDVLILLPTRELAIQVEEVFKKLMPLMPVSLKSMAVYGGVSINPQMKNLIGTSVLIATPGRLLDLISKNAVNLSNIRQLVLDEADQVLSLGFKDEVDKILALLPPKKQSMLFSATVGESINILIDKVLSNPEIIQLNTETVTPDQIEQQAYYVNQEKKGPFLRELLQREKPQRVLIFASSVRTVDNIVQKLNKNGFDAMALHSQKSQGARTDALTKFKNGKTAILVATDLAARGIDIPLLPMVINYELPRSPQDYVHRIGRTGRAEQKGIAISFISEDEKHHFDVIQKKMKKLVPFLNAEADRLI